MRKELPRCRRPDNEGFERCVCAARKCGRDPVAQKHLSIALFRARQQVRKRQAEVRHKFGTEQGAPSSLRGAPPQTRAPLLEQSTRTDQWKEWRTCKDTQTFLELFTDPQQGEATDWLRQRWPREVWTVQTFSRAIWLKPQAE